MLNPISENQFDLYVLVTRNRYANILAKEVRWFKNDTDTIFGIVLRDNIDYNYTSMLLCRDSSYYVRYRKQEIDFESIEEAEKWLMVEAEKLEEDDDFIQRQEMFKKNKRMDIFRSHSDEKKLNSIFKLLRDDNVYAGAKKVISEIMPYFFDIDGNYIQQFQTTGFDARLWEMYLFCYFEEEGLEVIRDGRFYAPDFYLRNGSIYVGVEAVTVGRIDAKKNESDQNIDILELMDNKMPIRYGSALYSKIRHVDKNNGKHYWEFEHIKDNPFVIAIADFHEDLAMMWTTTALITYLYGYKYSSKYDEYGNLIILPEKIEKHVYGDKCIESGLFFQKGSEHISAILFSASGTLSKFNRIGKQCGFDKSDIKMVRNVMCYNPAPNASKPIQLCYEVSEDNSEAWGEGITVFHNPNAVKPLPKDFFSTVTQDYFIDGYIYSDMPYPHVYSSFTSYLVKNEKDSDDEAI